MMKLAVLQRLATKGNKDPRSDYRTPEDIWTLARKHGGDHLELDPANFSKDLVELLQLEIKKVEPRLTGVFKKKQERLLTEEQVVEAFMKAWNRLTRRIKAETIKVI